MNVKSDENWTFGAGPWSWSDSMPYQISRGMALVVGQPALLKGFPPLLYKFTSVEAAHAHTLAHNCLIQLWSWDALHVQKATPNNKRKNDAQWHKHMKFESLTSVLRIFGVSQQGIPKQWEVTVEATAVGCHSKRMPKQWDVTAKGSQSKGMPKQRDVTAKGWQSKGIPKQRDVTAKACQSNGMSQQWDVKAVGCQSKGCHRKGMSKQNKAKGCQSKGMSQQRDVKAKGCQSKGMPKQRDVTAKGCQRKGMSQQTEVKAKGCHSSWMSQQRRVKARACESKRMSKQWDVKAMGCHSSWMSQQWDVTAKGCQSKGMSKQRDVTAKGYQCDVTAVGTHSSGFIFATSSVQIWEMSRTKAAFSHFPLSLFEWCLARKLRFHIFRFQILRDFSHKSFVFTSETFTFWGKSRMKASFSHLPLSLFEASHGKSRTACVLES